MMEEKGKKGKNITISVGRITHAIIAKDWRPNAKYLEAVNFPKRVVDLLRLCWSAKAEERPSFAEIEQFLKVDAMQNIQGDAGTGKIRRTSTSGSLALRIIAKKRVEEKESGAGQGGDGGELSLDEMRKKFEELEDKVKDLEDENKELRSGGGGGDEVRVVTTVA
ncbi:hypothetical protein TrLO_g10001 [Triparma laevis f. longispina]|nr:hypothetical protein TrLO_g10001 [Triparma laevis f. longispina]